ncbi:MAG: hypothetical protein WA951_12730, partial [Leeuwenhoekiella sp.]
MLYQGLCAQQLLPPVTNYSVDEYGGASQNWDVSSNEDGVIFAANNDGLLRFDGQRWQLYNLPNKTIIRSVLSVERRIYTGSYEEFGYWQKNEFGTLDYTSLTHLLQPNSFDNEEFWQIESYGDGVAFRSFGKVYYYNGEKIEAFRPDFLVASIYNLNGKLLIGSQKGGLYVWNNGQLDNMSQNATPGNTAIIDISYFNDELLIGTRNSGIFKLQDSKMIPWEKEGLGKFLSVNELNKIHPLSNTKIVFGTIQGGVLVLDLEKKETANYYRGNGLENNTVLALHHHNGDLWIGLDNGLDKINLQGGISYYLEKTGELGAVYDIAQVGDNLYLGSNTGVHLIRDNKRSFIEGSQGQLWSFSLINGEKLLANHNRGLFELNGEVFDPVSHETGSYSVIPFIGNQDYFINTTYNGLRILYDDGKGLQVLNDTLSLKGPINKAVFQGQSNLWASHPYKGFYKIEIDNRNKHLASYRSYTTDSTFSAFKTNIYKIKDQIAFSNGGRWFVYNSIEDEISYFEALRKYEDFDLVSQYNGAFWFKNRGGPGLVFTDFEKDSLFINEPILEDNLIKGYENIDRINDSIYYIALNDGYAAINLNQYRNKNSLRTIPVPDLNFFHAIGDSIAVNGKSQEVSYRDSRSLTFGFSAPSAINPKFVYRLNGEVQSGNDGTL